MKRFHLAFGVLLLVVFLLTGQYMDVYHNHLEGMPDGPRMLMRSRHIYILFAALLNIALGTYFSGGRDAPRRVLQLLGSLLILSAAPLLVAAFFYEPTLTDLQVPLSRAGIYSAVAGTLLHLFSSIARE